MILIKKKLLSTVYFYLNPKSINSDHRANIYINLIAKYLDYQDLKKIESKLKILFKKFNFNPNIIDKKLLNLIYLSVKNKNFKNQKKISDQYFHKKKLSNYSYKDLIEISNIFKKLGFFDISHLFISSAEKKILMSNLNNISESEIKILFGILVQKNLKKKVKILRDKVKNKKLKSIKEIDQLIYRVLNIDYRKENKTNYLNLSKYLNSKKIAFVCSSANKTKNGKLIDNNDIVCRFNTINFKLNKIHQGIKTNICFFSAGVQEFLNNSKISKQIINNCDWLIFKNPELSNKNTTIYKQRCLHLDFMFNGFFNGVLQNLPRSILFMRDFSTKSLNIYNCDLHYSLEYSNDSAINKIIDERKYFVPKSSVSHDPLTHLRLIRTLSRNKLINLDEKLQKIIKKTDSENMLYLSKIYKIEDLNKYIKFLRKTI